jgi:hypothetical protein
MVLSLARMAHHLAKAPTDRRSGAAAQDAGLVAGASSFQEPDMLTRSIESTIHFSQPFRLTQFDRAQPAGSYHLITEEEQLEGLSFAAFRRVRTLLYLPANALPGRAREVIDVDPNELAVALVVDAMQSLCGRLAETT